jgi:hypothetical protein
VGSQGIQVIDGKVVDEDGRPLWIEGLDGPGRRMTVQDLLLLQFAGLHDVLITKGHRAATEAAEHNLGMDLWGTELRDRLAARQAATRELSADQACRWVAEQLAAMLDRPLIWDGAFGRTGSLGNHIERARDLVHARMELLYDVVEFLLDKSEATA